MEMEVVISTVDGTTVHKITAATPYDAVNIARSSRTYEYSSASNAIALGEMIPLHNLSGIRDTDQVLTMIDKISVGKHILESDGLPNVKIAKAKSNRHVIFDGHHSLLAYYSLGKNSLKDIPHIVVTGAGSSELPDEQITFFFPEKNRSDLLTTWPNYVVNWQNKNNLVENRQVKNFAELFTEFSKRHKGSSKK